MSDRESRPELLRCRRLGARPLRGTVQATTLDGMVITTTYENGLARLVHHEIDHLDGLL